MRKMYTLLYRYGVCWLRKGIPQAQLHSIDRYILDGGRYHCVWQHGSEKAYDKCTLWSICGPGSTPIKGSDIERGYPRTQFGGREAGEYCS